jgi:hypothetical protein
VTPLLLLAAGLIAIGAAFLVLRSFGPGFRVGRLLASTPKVSVADAIGIAERGERRYVAIAGRVDSDDEFEDADHRPLVLRRTRIERLARGGLAAIAERWIAFEDIREAVPFTIREGLDAIAVDTSALREGLVVVRRESMGVVADLGDRAPEGVPPDDPARLVLEQVSSVEHAVVVGVPERDGAEGFRMTAGLGRPLVLTTLESDEAMRVLTGGSRVRVFLAGGLLGLGILVAALGLLWAIAAALAPHTVLAASPEASVVPGSDTRSPGQGPGLVGNPALAIAGVVGIGVLAVVLTLAYLRLTRGSDGA